MKVQTKKRGREKRRHWKNKRGETEEDGRQERSREMEEEID